MHCLSLSKWIPRLLLLLVAAWGAWAEERQCSLDSECGYREECRKAVVNKVVSAVKTCQCHHFVFADGHDPQCIACNWRSVMAAILMTIPLLAFTFAQTQYMVAFKEHMTDPPLRLVETRFKRAISLRTLFLFFSVLAATSAQLFAIGCILTIYVPVSTQFWYHDPLSPIQLGSSLHAFGAASAFLVVVCIWVRVAAKLHDPAGSTKKALYQLAFALDGSGIGLYLAVFLALPTGVVIIYFLLHGSWDHAFIGFAIFVTCGLILTSLAAKLLVARKIHQYELQHRGLRPPTPKSWAFCDCLRRKREADPPTAGPVEGVGSEDVETGEATEEKDEAAERERRTQESLAWRQALQGDVVVSVSAESIISSLLSSYSEPMEVQEDHHLRPGFKRPRSERPRAAERWLGSEGGASKSEETKETEKTEETGDTEAGNRMSREDGSRATEPSRRTQGSSSTNQSHEFTGAAFIELRVRIIQWEAATLGKRVVLTAVAGLIALLFAMPYGPWTYTFFIQWVGLSFGGVGLVGANANCLCYISPAVRRNVRRWRNGRNPLLSCIAVLLWKSHA